MTSPTTCTLSHNDLIFSHGFNYCLCVSNFILKSLYNSSTYISKCPDNISLYRHPSDFRPNLSIPNKSLFPHLFQRNKPNNSKVFLKVSVTVKGTAPLQGLQVDSSFDNQRWCPDENLISETRGPGS